MCYSSEVDWHFGGRRVAVLWETGNWRSVNFRQENIDLTLFSEQGNGVYSHRLQSLRMDYSSSSDSPPLEF